MARSGPGTPDATMHPMSVRRRPSGPGPVAHGSDPGPPMTGLASQRPERAEPPTRAEPPARSLEAELAERLDTVLGIAERMAASHDRKDLFRTIVDETKRVLRADCVTIRVVVDDRLVVAAWAGLPDDVAAALPVLRIGESWVGEVARTGRVAAWSDVRDDPRPGSERYDGILEFAGDLIAPLTHHDVVIGTLSATTRAPRNWTAGDIAFV